MAIHPDPDRDPADVFAHKVFARCPACRLVTPAGHQSGADWSRPVRVGCSCCGQAYDLRRDDLLALDEVATCPSCGGHTPCPHAAAQVRCRTCDELFAGPHADAARIRVVQRQRVRLAVEDYRANDERRER